MRLLVTGGAGYIGGFVTRLLVKHGHEVTVLDDLSSGHPAAAGGAELVDADVGDEPLVARTLSDRGIDAVLHFAAKKSVGQSWEDPHAYFDVNVAKTLALLRAMESAAVTRLIYSGSCGIYGDTESVPIVESHPADPQNPYAASKWLAEQAITWIARASGLRFVALRYFNAAGAEPDGSAGEDPRYADSLIPIVMRASLGIVAHVAIFGTDYPTNDGTAVRDYTHVVDLAEAHVKALDYLVDGGSSCTLNLGTGAGTSVRQIIEMTEQVAGRSVPVRAAPRRAGDPTAVWADASLAERTLGWRANLALGDIIESAWAWHSRHPQGYGSFTTEPGRRRE
jgi:UDP-glucose 4-epimerase